MSGLCEYEPSSWLGFLKVKFYIARQVQVDVPDMKKVEAGSKQDPKTFKSSSNLGIKISAVQSSKVRSLFLLFLSPGMVMSRGMVSGLACPQPRGKSRQRTISPHSNRRPSYQDGYGLTTSLLFPFFELRTSFMAFPLRKSPVCSRIWKAGKRASN